MKPRGKKMGSTIRRSILAVDDDPHILEVMEARLTASGFAVITASSSEAALEQLKQEPIDLMVCDVKLPDINGFQLFEKIRSMREGLPVIFLTAFGTIPDAVRAMKAGAVEYLTKPFDGRELVSKINEVLQQVETVQRQTAPTLHQTYMGRNPAMKDLHDRVQRVAAIDVNVLILGESGVGKERFAHMVHDLSNRREQAFVVVDCGSTPTTLLESELFGHVKGAFTHAVVRRRD